MLSDSVSDWPHYVQLSDYRITRKAVEVGAGVRYIRKFSAEDEKHNEISVRTVGAPDDIRSDIGRLKSDGYRSRQLAR
jgi:hypothetical protein